MTKVAFNVDAYTARLIGRENVAKLNGAILELVKNSYDADASICFLYFDEDLNTLYIGDNGTGMGSDIIQNHWMTIGLSTKKNRYMSKSGRVQTGAKGIGRFALDRIADKCKMLSLSIGEGLLWTVDWRDFDNGGAITEVKADLEETHISFSDFLTEIENDSFKQLIETGFMYNGTIFKLTLLRDKWGRERMKDIRNELSTLIPHELSNSFNIYLFSNTTSAADATVLHDNDAFSYDYKTDFEVSKEGKVQIQIHRNEFDFGSKLEHIIKGAAFSTDDRAYFSGTPICINTTFSELISKGKDKIQNSIGGFRGSLYFAKLSTPKSEKLKFYYRDISDRRNYLSTFGGIKVYRDQFRVRPYGDPNTSNFDWLQLAARKNSSPAGVANPNSRWRVRSDQMLGSIFISRTNLTLPDQANREGIVETKEFGLLRESLIRVIEFLEHDRQYVCRKLDELYDKETEAERYRKEIEEKAQKESFEQNDSVDDESSSPATMVEASKAHKVIQAKEKQIKILEDENRLLRVLATTGIATNSYIHEFQEQTRKLSLKITMAIEALEYDNDQEEALRHLSIADAIRNSFTSWFRVTVESVRRDKRSIKELELNEYITDLCGAWEDVVSEKNIMISLDLPNEPVILRCFPYEIEIILNNLITNSSSILSPLKMDSKLIQIRLRELTNSIVIDYHDNGPGLASAYKADPELILEPFETDKTNDFGDLIGTGMGMWLLSRTINEYSGTIDLSRNITEPSGFFVELFCQN